MSQSAKQENRLNWTAGSRAIFWLCSAVLLAPVASGQVTLSAVSLSAVYRNQTWSASFTATAASTDWYRFSWNPSCVVNGGTWTVSYAYGQVQPQSYQGFEYYQLQSSGSPYTIAFSGLATSTAPNCQAVFTATSETYGTQYSTQAQLVGAQPWIPTTGAVSPSPIVVQPNQPWTASFTLTAEATGSNLPYTFSLSSYPCSSTGNWSVTHGGSGVTPNGSGQYLLSPSSTYAVKFTGNAASTLPNCQASVNAWVEMEVMGATMVGPRSAHRLSY
jgi:hypothetical protein